MNDRTPIPQVISRLSVRAGRFVAAAIVIGAAFGVAQAHAAAEAQLLIEADTGKVLFSENATYPWYPASVTKLMTTYVTLRAVKDGKLSLDKLVTVSANAAAQSPSKMGFKVGTQLTIDNALKMMMVKSANDMAVVLAEGVSGSIDNFADDMNKAARRLGMTQTSYVNPNGLPADGQITSARDLAILSRAMIKELPEYDIYWHIPAIKFGKRTIRNINQLIDRYPGADGMKTGFICASGFNLVAAATRNGKRLIAVILGASSGAMRSIKAAQLLERGFNAPPLSWLTPSLGTVDELVPIDASPPDLREATCGKNRRRGAPVEEAEETEDQPSSGDAALSETFPALSLANVKGSSAKGADLIAPGGGTPSQVFEVYIGPARNKPQGTQIATAAPDLPAKPLAAKPGQIAPGAASAARPKAVTANALPWTNFSPSSLVSNPPPDLTTVSGGPVPMPRPRPKASVKH